MKIEATVSTETGTYKTELPMDWVLSKVPDALTHAVAFVAPARDGACVSILGSVGAAKPKLYLVRMYPEMMRSLGIQAVPFVTVEEVAKTILNDVAQTFNVYQPIPEFGSGKSSRELN
jgi:hypothetical protein